MKEHSFESAMERIEEIAGMLKAPVSLAQSLELYKEAAEFVAHADRLLKEAELVVEEYGGKVVRTPEPAEEA